jgi:hypothetical protein
MADKIIPDDLRNKPSDQKTNDYFLVTVNDLNPAENYNFQFRWVYEDSTTSEWSSTFSTFTVAEGTPFSPRFTSNDLSGGNGFVKLTWTGLNALDNPMTGIKQVNIWIKGGTYGDEFVNSGQFFTEAGTKTITLPFGQYFFKIQAQTALGTLSLFSDTQSARSFKTPLAVSNISGSWVKDDGTTKTNTLKIAFTFNPTFSDATNSALDVNNFIIKLTNTSNSLYRSFILPVNKSSSSQAFYLSASQNIATFGLFAKQFTVSVTAIDSFGNTSVVVSETSLEYTTPLDVPVITLTKGILSYSVAWNSQDGKPLDQIYIEEVESSSNTAPSTGYTQVAQGNQNPLIVQTLNSNKRWVRAKFYDSTGNATTYSIARDVTPDAAVTADTEGPSNVTSVTTTAGIDTSGYLGFNGYIDVEWPAVTGGGIRGYRIRFSNDNGTTYSYVDSPGTGTKYRLGGLAIGSTYKIAVATYDEFNNTSTSYIAASDRLIPGTPSMSNYISAGNIKLGYGVDGANDVGLYLNTNNYWYLNSSNSARLKVGGSTDNYLEWDGSDFVIDGNITAQQGTFKGNVSIISGGSLYSGTIAAGEISGNGYILNTSGLAFYQNSTEKTVINASNGKFTTISANIGGWDVNDTTISKNGITLNSSGTIIANKNAYYVGIKAQVSSENDIVLWAGLSPTGGSITSGANFRVTAGGNLYATGAAISGALVIESGSTFDLIALAKLKADEAKALADTALQPGDLTASDVILAVNSVVGSTTSTAIVGGAISTGTLVAGTYIGPTAGSDYSSRGVNISLDTGGISAPGFYITPGANASANFKGNIKASNIDAESRITGAEIVGAVFKTSATVNKTDRPASGVYIDSTGIYGYGTNVSAGEELFKLTAGTLTTKSAVIGPLTLANGAITSTQFSIDVNGNATFNGAVEGGTLTTTPVNGDKVIIKENDIQFYSNGATYGSLKISDNSLTMSIGLGQGRIAFAKTGNTSIWSGGYGRIDLFSTSSIMTSPDRTNNIDVGNSYVNVNKAANDGQPSLRNISFTQTPTQPSGGNIGDIVLVFA